MTIGGRGMAANANFGTCGNGGNDNGNDGGKWESTFAAPIVAVIVILSRDNAICCEMTTAIFSTMAGLRTTTCHHYFGCPFQN